LIRVLSLLMIQANEKVQATKFRKQVTKQTKEECRYWK